MFSDMLMDASQDYDSGFQIRYCFDGKLFNHYKKPKGNDRSPESQQVQSLDKRLFLPYTDMSAILVREHV